MSEKAKEDSTNLYDKAREEVRQKQRVEAERKQRAEEMLNQSPNAEILNKLKGENN